MNLDFKGLNALVCGSSQGIGRAVAKELASLGASVTLFARNEETLNTVKSELAVVNDAQHHQVLIADFSNSDAVKHVINDHVAAGNNYQILINNTGGPAPGPAHQAENNAFINAFNLHLVNNHSLVQALLPAMKEANYGRIINVISTSVKAPLPNLGVSNTIRGAVASWAKTLSNELGQFNVTVNNVLPGATNTARLDAILENKAKKLNKTVEEVSAADQAEIPMRRFGEPEEFANAVAFLASPSAGYITGINLPVDGGRTSSL